MCGPIKAEKAKITINADASTTIGGFHGKVGMDKLAVLADALKGVGIEMDLTKMTLKPGKGAHAHAHSQHQHEHN